MLSYCLTCKKSTETINPRVNLQIHNFNIKNVYIDKLDDVVK